MRIENGFSLPIWASNSLGCPEQHLLQSFSYYRNLDGGPLLEFLKESLKEWEVPPNSCDFRNFYFSKPSQTYLSTVMMWNMLEYD